ncbi:MAG TPA: chlorophyllase, partial [Micromonospora sp.]
MRRRRPTELVTAAALAAVLAGCSTGDGTGHWAAPAPGASSAAAGSPSAAPSASAPGKAPTRTFPVRTRQLSWNRDGDRPLPVTVWYPGSATGPADGRFPVVLFSHGLGASPADYAGLLRRWAAAGFVVAAPTYPHTGRGAEQNPFDVLNQPADASYVLTRLLALDGRADDP